MQNLDAERLVLEMAERLRSFVTDKSAIVGIHTGGAWLAEKLHPLLGASLPMGMLDVSFYRDDFGRSGLHPDIEPSEIAFDVTGRDIILIDDVLFTGRSVRAAMNELFDYGRPASIILAVLVDRGGRELPISAQVTGATMTLGTNQNIKLSRNDHGELALTLFDR